MRRKGGGTKIGTGEIIILRLQCKWGKELFISLKIKKKQKHLRGVKGPRKGRGGGKGRRKEGKGLRPDSEYRAKKIHILTLQRAGTGRKY